MSRYTCSSRCKGNEKIVNATFDSHYSKFSGAEFYHLVLEDMQYILALHVFEIIKMKLCYYL